MWERAFSKMIKFRERRIVSLVTLYNPRDIHINNVDKLLLQSDLVIVCDNSNANHHNFFKDKDKCVYLHWGENYGLSKAFNLALNEKNIGWNDEDIVVFFDQDSVVPQNHISILLKEFESLERSGLKVGCIGPVYFDSSTGKNEIPRLYHRIKDSVISVDSIVTTSMLCKYRTIKSINFWNEDIFLDMADWDICWRLMYSGYSICMTKKTIINHSVGDGIKKVGLFQLRVGQPFREYYQTRDCLKLLEKKYTPYKYKIRFVAMIVIRPIMHMLFLDYKINRAKYIVKGIIDYFKKTNGALQ